MHLGRKGRRVGGGVGNTGKEDNKENKEKNGKNQRSAAQSSVSFSLEKETEEPSPLPLPHFFEMIGWNQRSCNQININMILKNTLCLFITTLISAAQYCNS